MVRHVYMELSLRRKVNTTHGNMLMNYFGGKSNQQIKQTFIQIPQFWANTKAEDCQIV